jgi:hypothetical protein
MLHEFYYNLTHNLFKPLLLFFYAGFLIPILRIKFEFPKAVYQGLTIYLLLAIGWHGGEELASLPATSLVQALGFMAVGFLTNTVIGLIAYFVLRSATRLRAVDAATVAGYYGSDSAGTFVTAMGVLVSAQVAYAAYMPVMLAVMEIPGCLVALYLVSRLRHQGMDVNGNMPYEKGYQAPVRQVAIQQRRVVTFEENAEEYEEEKTVRREMEYQVATAVRQAEWQMAVLQAGDGRPGVAERATAVLDRREAETQESRLALEVDKNGASEPEHESRSAFSPELLHEVFLNPGIYLLFAGIAIGFISRVQGEKVTAAGDQLFSNLFQGILCVFLLEMGMTAASKLKDLRYAGWQFVLYGLIAPNVFAATGLMVAHMYSLFVGQPFEIGTYVLFAVLCGAASYIAVPAVQRLAIPEASPTLPLAASLGLTFSYNVTIGIPLYLMFAKILTTYWPVVGAAHGA